MPRNVQPDDETERKEVRRNIIRPLIPKIFRALDSLKV